MSSMNIMMYIERVEGGRGKGEKKGEYDSFVM